MTIQIVPRTGLLDPPSRKIPLAPRLRNRLYLHHSVTASTSNYRRDWQRIQDVAFDRGFADISYTFGVHVSGVALEGRSPSVVGAHTEGYNTTAHAIVLIGNYNIMQPSTAQINTVRELRQLMVVTGILTPDHAFRYHRQDIKTECPGMNAIRKFNEFAHPYIPGQPMPQPPMFNPAIPLRPIVATMTDEHTGGFWQLADDGSVYNWEGAPYNGGCNGKSYFVGKLPAKLDIPRSEREIAENPFGYVVVATSGERFGPGFPEG